MNALNLGVVGVGEMGRRHAENLRRSVPHARLVAVADIDLERARTVAAELEIDAAYPSVEALAAHSGLDAVVIASPPKYHLPAIVAAAAAGKHVFCEKPLALSLDDADAALDAVRKAGVILQVGHMRRYDPPYAAARSRIEAGEIGQIVVFKSIGRDQETSPAGACQVEANGTLFHDSTAHDFDLARWLTGDEIVEVHAFGSTVAIPELRRVDAFDAGVVNLQFASGAIGNIESFMDAKYGYDIRTEIVGTKGTLFVGQLAADSTRRDDPRRKLARRDRALVDPLLRGLSSGDERFRRRPFGTGEFRASPARMDGILSPLRWPPSRPSANTGPFGSSRRCGRARER